MSKSKIVVIAVIIAAIAAFMHFDLGQYFSLEYIQQNKANFDAYYAENQFLTMNPSAGSFESSSPCNSSAASISRTI